MGGQLIPGDAFQIPWSAFEDPVTAQFIHRWLAIAERAAGAGAVATRGKPSGHDGETYRTAGRHGRCIQAGLGIGTLLLVVPIPLAAAHQAGAVVLWTLVLWSLHATRQTSARR